VTFGCARHGGYHSHSHHCPSCIKDAVILLRFIRDAQSSDGLDDVRTAAERAIALLGFSGASEVKMPGDTPLSELLNEGRRF
jgi:hypothetical protein